MYCLHAFSIRLGLVLTGLSRLTWIMVAIRLVGVLMMSHYKSLRQVLTTSLKLSNGIHQNCLRFLPWYFTVFLMQIHCIFYLRSSSTLYANKNLLKSIALITVLVTAKEVFGTGTRVGVQSTNTSTRSPSSSTTTRTAAATGSSTLKLAFSTEAFKIRKIHPFVPTSLTR